MKIFSFIYYFFYLGLNWNWRIALHIISHEIKGEKKYGIQTTGADELKRTAASGVDITHATVYMPASYLLMEEIFGILPADSRNHFLDIGSGMGRAVCVAVHHGYNKVTGIDFSPQFCMIAEENLRLTTKKFPKLDYHIICKDAGGFQIPADVDCIFLFNPFDQVMMKTVVSNIRDSYKDNPRDIYIIYLNPLYKSELFGIGFKEIFYTKKLKYMEAVILQKTRTKSLVSSKA